MPPRWDIFCKVVDNFGDAGVAWRLARQLAHEHSLIVRLWIDDPRSLARMAPIVDAQRDLQRAAGIEIRRWHEPFAETAPADVVVEAFGCGLPVAYTAAMAKSFPPPIWFVLEYLSAETWIDGAHGLPSPHPQLPLTRRFWFPGFSPASGGLLRERGLFAHRDVFQNDNRARADFWASLAVPAPMPGELRISLFCYPVPILPALLDAWADGNRFITCVVPEDVAVEALDDWTSGNAPRPGWPVPRGRLTLHAIPFLSQDDYDRLLWACDVNFVRGEDSFVRAQWAARPFAWHIYPQTEDAHHRKLGAFVDRYASALDPFSASAVRSLFLAWNGAASQQSVVEAWRSFAAARPALDRHAGQWSAQLAALTDLATGLVNATSDRV